MTKKKNSDRKLPKRKGTPGFLVPLVLIGIFVAIGAVAYFLLTRMNSNNTYQIPQHGENEIGIFMSGKYFQSINSTDLLQSLIENITSVYNISNVRLLMFGSPGCPHCRAMDTFFNENYPGIYEVIWITGSGGSLNLTWFVSLASEEVQQGIPEQYATAVPQILVLDGSGRLRGIVIGEITDKAFWDLLLEKTG